MSNFRFQFKHFLINQDKTAMKVGIDAVLLGAVSHFNHSLSILDVGAGTGLLSFMAAQRTNAEITALEIEKNAFNQCVENVEFNKKKDRIRVINSSFQEFYKNSKQKYDFIICNPPFFENSAKSQFRNRNIARHSEMLSKFDLVTGVSELLNSTGRFSVILPYEFEKSFEKLCDDFRLFSDYKFIIYPKSIKQPNRIIMEFSFIKKRLTSEKIIIRENDNNQYTNAYKELTKDFYLHF